MKWIACVIRAAAGFNARTFGPRIKKGECRWGSANVGQGAERRGEFPCRSSFAVLAEGWLQRKETGLPEFLTR